ncbi:MFS transporter [Cellulomonas biazotea]|uniref:MFS transporter n=1 Tax=Cellulomonas biazotea TaxID=1709 RepID=A0A402DT02_9CELL|nr:MFS transporter [Cellulomonas biazotea]GCE77238.1 MFS transporter [Cellulomonas biazotea]
MTDDATAPTSSTPPTGDRPTHDSPDTAATAVLADAPGGTAGAGGAPAEADDRPGWVRDTVVFLSGQTVSLFGSMLVQYAVMWHLTLQTQSGSVLALSSVFGFLPQAVISIFGGVWADRHNRKLLIIAADATIAVTTLALALLMLGGADDLWLIYAALAIRSAGAGIQTPAVSALVPQIVPTRHLMRVNGINATIQSAMMLVAPAAAAAVYASFDIVAVFFVDVVTAAIGIGLLLLVPVARVVRTAADGEDAAPVGYFDDLVGGLRYIAGHAFVRWVLALFAVVFVLIVAPSYLTPLMVVRTFGDEVWKLTANELAFSIGMLIGGAVVATWAANRSRIGMIVGSTVAFGGISIGLGLSTNLWVFLGFMFLLGLGVPFFSTPSTTVLQETVEPQMQGRVFGFVGIVMAVAMPFGMAVFGPLADRMSVELLLVLAGVALFVVVGVALALPSGRRALEDARRQTVAPADV